MELTDEFFERVNSEIYAERRRRDPEIATWETWADFVADPINAERVPVWRAVGIEIIARLMNEAAK